jgi:GNAT superfamily N-acetyltransferase
VEVGRSRHAPAAEFTLAALDPFERRGVAVGRYHRDARRPDAADVAVGVVKGWRRKGLGTALLQSLALAATERGIRRFSSIVPVDDVAALALLRSLNPEVIVLHRGFGVVRYEVTFGRRFCKLCGRQIESTGDDGHSADGPSNQVCGTCLRRYLPKVQLRLADPWWS